MGCPSVFPAVQAEPNVVARWMRTVDTDKWKESVSVLCITAVWLSFNFAHLFASTNISFCTQLLKWPHCRCLQFVSYVFLYSLLTMPGHIEYCGRLQLEHDAVDPTVLFAAFQKKCMGTDCASFAQQAFRKELKRRDREVGEMSSEDEEHLSPDQMHLESSVDANGMPIEFDAEDVLVGKRQQIIKRNKPSGHEALAQDSFVLMHPDPGCDDKIWMVQVILVNPEPENTATWVTNSNQKWHYFGGWWELTEPNILNKINKCHVLSGVAQVHANGTNTKIDWNDPAVVAPLEKGKKQAWLRQYFNRDDWGGEREILVNVIMAGTRDRDRKFKKLVVTKLHNCYPDGKYNTTSPRVSAVSRDDLPTPGPQQKSSDSHKESAKPAVSSKGLKAASKKVTFQEETGSADGSPRHAQTATPSGGARETGGRVRQRGRERGHVEQSRDNEEDLDGAGGGEGASGAGAGSGPADGRERKRRRVAVQKTEADQSAAVSKPCDSAKQHLSSQVVPFVDRRAARGAQPVSFRMISARDVSAPALSVGQKALKTAFLRATRGAGETEGGDDRECTRPVIEKSKPEQPTDSVDDRLGDIGRAGQLCLSHQIQEFDEEYEALGGGEYRGADQDEGACAGGASSSSNTGVSQNPMGAACAGGDSQVHRGRSVVLFNSRRMILAEQNDA